MFAAAREYIAQQEDVPTFSELFGHLVERGLCEKGESRRARHAVSNAIRRGKVPRLPSSYAEWPPVIEEAQRIVGDRRELPTFRELCDELEERGVLGEHQRTAFRGALGAAQRRGEFPQLRPGSASVAHVKTAHEVQLKHRADCARYLAEALEGRQRVELNPRAMRSLADAGFGAFTVAWAIALLRDRGVATVERGPSGIVLRERQEELTAA